MAGMPRRGPGRSRAGVSSPGRRAAIGEACAHGRAGGEEDGNGGQADGSRAGPQGSRTAG